MRDRLLVAHTSPESGGKLLLAYAGEQVFLVNAAAGSKMGIQALPSPPTTTTTQQQTPTPAPVKSATPPAEGLGQVEALAFNREGTKAAALYRHKVLALWDIGTAADGNVIKLLAHRILPKKAYALIFAQLADKEDVLLVNDKVGDVRAYHATAELLPKTSALLLGHTASVGTCLDLSPDGTCLASGDRDEKVRLSQFPCTLIIHGYLTGHDNFVSTVRFLKDGNTVLTASGDGTLALWDAKTGEEQAQKALPVSTPVEQDVSPTEQPARHPRKAAISNAIVPCAIATSPLGDIAVVTVLNQPQLYVYSLPSLELVQTIDTPSVPLGVAVLHNTVYVTLGAPEYMVAYSFLNKSLTLLSGNSVAEAVQAHAVAQGIQTEVTVDEGDEGLLGGLTKENLEQRHEWNNRQRKDEFAEKSRQKKREKRQKQRDERVAASETKVGEAATAAAAATAAEA